MSAWQPRRFWTEARAIATARGHEVELDGRPVRTPARAPLVLPTQAMAEAAAAEWDAQADIVEPQAMPVTRAANVAIDKVAPAPGPVAAEIAGYGETDLLCYRAGEPARLAERQAAAWDPLLDWAESRLGARLTVTEGVMYVPQPEAALSALRGELARHGAFALTALSELAGLSGSLVIALAAAHGHAPAEALWAVSRLDETWQEEHWGEDAEAAATAARRRRAFLAAARFHAMSGGR